MCVCDWTKKKSVCVCVCVCVRASCVAGFVRCCTLCTWNRACTKKALGKDLLTDEWMATAFTHHSGGDISRVSAQVSLSEKREMGPSHPQRRCSHLHTHAYVWRKRRRLKLGEQRDLGWARRQVGVVLGSGC